MRYWPFVSSVLAGILAGVSMWLFDASPKALTIVGGGFQLSGLGIVVFLLARARNLFGMDSWRRQSKQFVRRLFRRPREAVGSVRAVPTYHRAAGRSAGAALPPHATLEQRVDRLESVTERIEETLRTRFTEHNRALREKLTVEREARIAKDARLEKWVRAPATEDEPFHLAGATLFFFGIIFQTCAVV